MRTNVTVHQPRPRVVRGERQHHPAPRGKEGDISSWRIGELEVRGVGLGIKNPRARAKNPKIVAVQVDGVEKLDGRGSWLLNNPKRPLPPC